jgi:hypothetical protein
VSIRTRLTAPGTALPLALLYAALAALHVWQALRHATPTIFTDEIEFTQVSRSIADGDGAAFRGGEPSGYPGLYAYLAAPAWWLDSVGQSYGVIKTLGALLMTAVVFPSYFLARLLVGRTPALLAAAGAGAAPALAYSPILVEEPVAYPAATLALLLVMRWAAMPTWGRFALAAGGCVLGFLTRTQLSILFVVLGLVALVVVWRTARLTAWRRGWTRGDWLGAAVLALGVAVVAGAVISRRSYSWYVATTFYKDRMLDFGLWSVGALAIGIGVLPLVAALAALVPARARRWTGGERGFVLVTVAAIGCFVVYTAVKGAYISTVHGNVVPERNLIYLTPLLFAGGAWLVVRGGRAWAVAAAGAFCAWLVVATPYSLAHPTYDAHGFAILALANREFRWDVPRMEHVLLLVAIAGTAVLLLLPALHRRALRLGAAGLLAAGVLAWTLTTQVYAASGERAFADRIYSTLPKPANWLDAMAGDDTAVFLGQGIADPNPIWSLEFWNRSLTRVWSLDGTAPGPGAVTTADLGAPDGTLRPEPGTQWLVASRGVEVRNPPPLTPVGDYQVQPLDGPIQLASATVGVSPDGWMGETAAYNQYDVEPGALGLAEVVVARTGWLGKDVPGQVTVRIGPVAIDENRQPTLASVTQVARDEINAGESIPFILRAPPGPWRVEIHISPTFSPHELDPAIGDNRQLGAQVSFGYRPLADD